MTEKELVDGCIKEDRKCQERLWKLFAPKLLSVSLRYCKSREDAEDVVMESFVKIFDHLHEFRYQSSLETWMRRIVVNSSINKLRSFKFTESIDEQVYQIGFTDKAFEQLNEKELLKMLESLPVGYRTVFNMYAIEGYSHKEISDSLGIDEGTSRSQLAKARKTLQDMVLKTERKQA